MKSKQKDNLLDCHIILFQAVICNIIVTKLYWKARSKETRSMMQAHKMEEMEGDGGRGGGILSGHKAKNASATTQTRVQQTPGSPVTSNSSA